MTEAGFDPAPAESTPGNSLPDLLIHVGTTRFAVECAVRLPPKPDQLTQRREQAFFDMACSAIANAELRLHIVQMSSTTTTPSAKAFAKFLDSHVDEAVPVRDTHTWLKRDAPQFEWTCPDSGWHIAFWLLRRDVASERRSLVYLRSFQIMSCTGDESLLSILDDKRIQHASGQMPLLLAVAWNHFEDELELEDAKHVVGKFRSTLSRSGVVGVLWAGPLYPWNVKHTMPTLIAWDDSLVDPIWSAWQSNKTRL